MFPLISSITQQQQQSPHKPPIHPPSKHFPSKNLVSSFSKSFISSGKQGGGATVLREGRDTVTRETCVPTSLNINNLGKLVVLYFAFPLFNWGLAKLSL
jgi:hypothetical protein